MRLRLGYSWRWHWLVYCQLGHCFADRLGYLFHRSIPEVAASLTLAATWSRAFQLFCPPVFDESRLWIMLRPPAQVHIKFTTRSTCPISLCKMVCSPRPFHLMVTPAQFVSVTVPRSARSFCQKTRAPTLSFLDFSPVMVGI